MTRIGVIGYGYWGPNLVRNFSRNPRASVVRVADRDPKQQARIKSTHPDLDVVGEGAAVITGDDIDAVLIATPAGSHYALAKAALEAGKHVLVEKPMATTAAECRELCDLAASKGLTLLVDHTFIYTPAVQRIRRAVECGELGEVYYVDSVRINLGLFQQDVNVIWDLAPHDLAVFEYCFNRKPLTVQAIGAKHAGSPLECVAHLYVEYEGGLTGHVHVNWLSPVKVRQMIVGGSRRMIVFNDLEPSEKLRIYDKGADVDGASTEMLYSRKISYRSGDMLAPALSPKEALEVETDHFLDCIQDGAQPWTGGEAGFRVVQILEAAQQSLEQDSMKVRL